MEAIVIKRRWVAWLVGMIGAICVIVTPTMIARANDTSTAQVTFQQATTSSSTTNTQATIKHHDTITRATKQSDIKKNSTRTSRDYQKNDRQTNQGSSWRGYLPQTDEQACRWLLVIMGLLLLILLLMAVYYGNKCERYQHSVLHE